jgi:hypothetical protein
VTDGGENGGGDGSTRFSIALKTSSRGSGLRWFADTAIAWAALGGGGAVLGALAPRTVGKLL